MTAPVPSLTGEQPINRLVLELAGEITVSFQRRIQEVMTMAAEDAQLPKGVSFDLKRGVWILPPIAP